MFSSPSSTSRDVEDVDLSRTSGVCISSSKSCVYKICNNSLETFRDMNKSHFSYSCEIRYPLNLELEN